MPLHDHPLKQLRVSDQGLKYVDAAGAAIVARQQLEPTWRRNGVAYALTRACLVDQQRLLGTRAGFVKLEGDRPSIDDEADLTRCATLLSQESSDLSSPDPAA